MSDYILRWDDRNYVTMIKREHKAMREQGYGDTVFFSPDLRKAWRMTKEQAEFWKERNPRLTITGQADASLRARNIAQGLKR